MAFLTSAVRRALGFSHAVPVILEFSPDVPLADPIMEMESFLLKPLRTIGFGPSIPTFLSIPTFRMVATVAIPELLDPLLALTGLHKVYHNPFSFAMEGIPQSRKIPLSATRQQIGAEEANAKGYTGSGVHVVVIDTGVDNLHPALQVRVREHTTIEDLPPDNNGHGTHVTSTIGGLGVAEMRTGLGGAGMAPQADLSSVKALGFGIGLGTSASVIKAMELAVQLGADVVNMSLGSDVEGSYEDDPQVVVLDRLAALERAPLFVVAAGNSGPSNGTIGSPGWARHAITVGAYDPETLGIADFSSRGPTADGRIKPDCTGPGVDIFAPSTGLLDLTTPETPKWASLSGTSMASPHVAGLLALAKQRAKEIDVRLSFEEVHRILSEYSGGKRVDVGWGAIHWSMFESWFRR